MLDEFNKTYSDEYLLHEYALFNDIFFLDM